MPGIQGRLLWAWMLLSGAGIASPLSAQPAGELIERTLAIVDGQVITLTDVQMARMLGLVEVPDGPDAVGAVTTRLVERALILREVQRYAPPEPSEQAIADRIAQLRERVGGEGFARGLASGFSIGRLQAWVRDDVRITAYLAQRFTAAVAPSAEEVAAYYQARRAAFEREGLTLEGSEPALRDRLAAERRAELIADWVLDLRRRTPVVELWKPGT